MRMIPPFIGNDHQSRAEQRLFDQLFRLDLPTKSTCLHSINLPEHSYKATGEIDFLIISQTGLYVLEVKGGGVSCHEGIWSYRNRWGKEEHNSEGPFNQASSGMYALLKRLQSDFHINGLNDMVIGFGVVFPDCEFSIQGMEWSKKQVLDASNFTSTGLNRFIKTLSEYWHLKFPEKPSSVSSTVVSDILQALRPDFEMIPSLQVRAGEIDTRLERLTNEQYERLDIIQDSPRILVEGGAGTGKTFLAAELARRLAHQENDVLMVCFSPLLASFLNTQIKNTSIKIFPINNLLLIFVKKYGTIPKGYIPGMPVTSPWFVRELVPAFENISTLIPETEKFDVLIMDEGQDVINLPYITALDALLLGGWEKGTWRIFFDPNFQTEIYSTMDDEVLKMLKSFGPVLPKLRKNCRNTTPIVIQTCLMTGAEIAAEGAGPGPEVSIDFYNTSEEAISVLEQILQKLQSQHISSAEITILSPISWSGSFARQIKPALRSKIKILEGSVQETFPHSNMTFSTITDFKGLENRFIIMADISDLDSLPSVTASLYVGMTRARVKLYILLPQSLKKKFQEISTNNLPRIN